MGIREREKWGENESVRERERGEEEQERKEGAFCHQMVRSGRSSLMGFPLPLVAAARVQALSSLLLTEPGLQDVVPRRGINLRLEGLAKAEAVASVGRRVCFGALSHAAMMLLSRSLGCSSCAVSLSLPLSVLSLR